MSKVLNPVGVPAPVVTATQERRLFTQIYSGVAQTIRTYSPDFTRSCYTKLMLRLSGQLSKTESVAGTLAGEGPLTLLKGIRILGDGDLIKEIDAAHLRILAHDVLRGQDTDLVNVTLGTDVSEAFSARLEIDFQSLRLNNPDVSWWDASRYKQIVFECDWGDRSDMVSGGTYTGVSFAATQLEVYGQEVLNPVVHQQSFMTNKYQQKVFSVSSIAQTAGSFQLPVGEVIRGILLSQYTLAPKTPISTLVISTGAIVIRLVGPQGVYRKIETTWSELQQRNRAKYQFTMPTGYAFIDFCEGGDIQTALRADGAGVTAVEMLVDTASVASAFLQATLCTFKRGVPPIR